MAQPFTGRAWTGVASRIVGLISEGKDYGKHNLNQLDLRFAKRFSLGGDVRLRVDFDLYNVFNGSWPYTVSNAYANTTTSAWLQSDQRAATPILQVRSAFLASDNTDDAENHPGPQITQMTRIVL